MLGIREAAILLGYSISGVRKLVRRRAIRHFQLGPHSPIKFKVEWISEFIDAGTDAGIAEDSPVKRRATGRAVASSDFVDLSLFKI